LATETVPSTHELSAQGWADGLEAEVLRRISVVGFVGDRSSALIQKRDFLEKNPGSQERIGLRRQSDRAPRTSGQQIENNEQKLRKFYMDLTVDEYADAYRWDNVMSRQYVTYDNRDEAKAALADQMANAWDRSFFNQIAGNATSEATIDATDTLGLDDVNRMVAIAKVGNLPIRPVMVEGFPQPLYVLFIHPWVNFIMRAADARWDDICIAALNGGMIGNNPLMTGAMGVHNGVLICENYRAPASATPGSGGEVVRRSVLCGAQAAVCGYGRIGGTAERYRWVEKLFDYDREMGCMAGFVGGLRKSVFTEETGGSGEIRDFATVVISSASHADDDAL
jgi:N4-gp56 family major capsid protein